MKNIVKMNNTTAATNNNAKMYDLVMNSTKQVGSKVYAYIPTELLFVDPEFQRDSNSAKFQRKVKILKEKWDINKMDALRVVPHPEEHKFSIIDGSHRDEVAIELGIPGLECEIVFGLPDDPEKRRVEEAKLFSTQDNEKDVLTPVEKHKAYVLCGVRENCILDKLVRKYNIPIKKNPSHGRVPVGALAGFTKALYIIKKDGESMMDDIFYILCESRWNIASKGLGALTITSVYHVLSYHPNYRNEIKTVMIDYFKDIEPENFFAEASVKYSKRILTQSERLTVYLEDVVCEHLDIERSTSTKKILSKSKISA